jgi:hypothetical protein
MDPNRIDQISKLFATRRLSRRAAVVGSANLGAIAMGAAALSSAKSTSAQGASPAASPAAAEAKTEFLFVQSFEAGTLLPKPESTGEYVLELKHGLGQTLYFSDRPERIVGAVPTQRFLNALGFSPTDPPNAALVADLGDGNEEIFVVELTNPVYDEAAKTATYDVKILDDVKRVDMTLGQSTHTGPQTEATYGASHLFIDDCPDGTLNCRLPCNNGDSGCNTLIGSTPIGYCYDALNICCDPCGYDWIQQCARAFAGCVNEDGLPACNGDVTGGKYSCG